MRLFANSAIAKVIIKKLILLFVKYIDKIIVTTLKTIADITVFLYISDFIITLPPNLFNININKN